MKTQVLILVAVVSLVVVMSMQIYVQAHLVSLLSEQLYQMNGGKDMQISIPKLSRPNEHGELSEKFKKTEELI